MNRLMSWLIGWLTLLLSGVGLMLGQPAFAYPEAVTVTPVAQAAMQSVAEVEGSMPSAFRAGVGALQQGVYDTALEHFTQAIEQQSHVAAAYSNRCLAAFYLMRYPEAVADCTRSLELNAANLDAYLNRGLARYYLQDLEGAIADYTQLLTLKPHDHRAHYNRGLAYASQRAYQQAMVDFGEALRQVSPLDRATLSEIHNEMGLTYLDLGNDRSALASFTQAVVFNPSNARAVYNRGCVYHQQGNLVAALEDFDRAIALTPDDADGYLSRGMVRWQLHQQAEAIADLQWAAACFCQRGQLEAHDRAMRLLHQVQTAISTVA